MKTLSNGQGLAGRLLNDPALYDRLNKLTTDLGAIQEGLDFPQTVYGVPRGTPARELMGRQSEWYGAHLEDRILPG